MTRQSLAVAFGLFALVSVYAPSAQAHGEESRVAIEREESADPQAGTVTFEFQLIDFKTKTVLGEPDLAVSHTKKLHAFFFDPALKEFRHEHPAYVNSKWRVTTNLSVSGNYWFWVQGKIATDGEEFSASNRVKLIGGTPANPLPPNLGDVRLGTDQGSTVTLSQDSLVAKQESTLMLNFSHADGSKPNLTPYLGELAHIVGVPEDGDSLLHTHPMDTGTPNELMVHATFPEAGQYRLWIQFIDGGTLNIVPMAVTVNSK